jgi:hypothetical protein
MSKKETQRASVLSDLVAHRLTQQEAAKMMWLKSRMQVSRLLKKFVASWVEWLPHGLRWKKWNRAMSEEYREIIGLATHEYRWRGYKPTHLSEMILQEYGIKVSPEKCRKIMIEENIRQDKKRKREQQRHRRKSKDYYGEMLQFDWWYHDWFEGRWGIPEACLLVSVDDATSNIPSLKFDINESKRSVFAFWKAYIIANGKPKSIYTDRHAVYKVNHPNATFDPDMITQLQRIWVQLDIKMIFAYSPQAKGKVERKIGVLEDRLVKMMRQENICTVEDANIYLQKAFIPWHDKKYGRMANKEWNLHTPLSPQELKELDRIFSLHETRKVNNDFTISYKNEIYQLYSKPVYVGPKSEVIIKDMFGENIRIMNQQDKDIARKKIPSRLPKQTPKKVNTTNETEEEKKTKDLETTKKKEQQTKNLTLLYYNELVANAWPKSDRKFLLAKAKQKATKMVSKKS